VPQRLTQAFVDQASGNGRDRLIFDSQLSGLALRITPTGTKIFVIQARVAGRKRRITIGYADKTTLAQAREEALQALAAMRGGVLTPPQNERRVYGHLRPEASLSANYSLPITTETLNKTHFKGIGIFQTDDHLIKFQLRTSRLLKKVGRGLAG
jgi:hypothetical protein